MSSLQKWLNTNLTDWFILAIRDTASVLFTNIVGSQLWISKNLVFSSPLSGYYPRLYLTSRRTVAQVNLLPPPRLFND